MTSSRLGDNLGDEVGGKPGSEPEGKPGNEVGGKPGHEAGGAPRTISRTAPGRDRAGARARADRCPAWGGSGARATLVLFSYYAALAVMWNLLAGYAGLVTFGQQLFIGLGGYTLAIGCERLGLGVWPAFALAAVLAARARGAGRRAHLPAEGRLLRGR